MNNKNKRQKRIEIKSPDIFDILSAIWVLACNDENPIITYEGIKYRLNLGDDFDYRGLVQSRGELFRRGVPDYRLDEWKDELRSGRHLPSWIQGIQDQNQRLTKINSITIDDVFRSQFRSGNNAPRSEIEIIDWGLQHIDRLRKASTEAQQEISRRWELRIVLIVAVLNLVATIAIAIVQTITSRGTP